MTDKLLASIRSALSGTECKKRIQYLISMMTEEYEIPLVVERDHASALELGVVWEERGERTTHCLPKAGVKIIEYHLWHVAGWIASLPDFFL